jgi:hypothetical protein
MRTYHFIFFTRNHRKVAERFVSARNILDAIIRAAKLPIRASRAYLFYRYGGERMLIL